MASHPAGHMCVSYNGQCFSSEAWGGRSANRGQCAQQCRMPYGLMVDGALKEIGDSSRYLLSPQVGDLPISPHMSIPHGLRRPSPTLSPRLHNPWPSATFDDLRPPPSFSSQDLSGIDHVSALLAAGVRTFKIEGRLKSAEYAAPFIPALGHVACSPHPTCPGDTRGRYVYVSTLAYRRAIDEAWEAATGGAATGEGAQAAAGSAAEAAIVSETHEDTGADLIVHPATADGADGSCASCNSSPTIRDEVARERRSTPAPLAADALRQVFARAQDETHDGHTPGFFDGPKHQTYVRGLSPSHRGVCAGLVVARPHHNTVRVRLRGTELSAGDGVAFGASSSDAGGTLWGVHTDEGADSRAGRWSDSQDARRKPSADEGGSVDEVEVTLEMEDASKVCER